jgi:hypothetical protein
MSANTNPREMMGLEIPGDRRVPISVRDWNAMRLALWRSSVGWGIVMRQAVSILDDCLHDPSCPGADSETELCLPNCEDREKRMSALVILNAARQFAPVDARRAADDQYFAPSREYFSEVLSSLAAAQAENEILREALRRAGIEAPTPPPNETPAVPPRLGPSKRELAAFAENLDTEEEEDEART